MYQKYSKFIWRWLEKCVVNFDRFMLYDDDNNDLKWWHIQEISDTFRKAIYWIFFWIIERFLKNDNKSYLFKIHLKKQKFFNIKLCLNML